VSGTDAVSEEPELGVRVACRRPHDGDVGHLVVMSGRELVTGLARCLQTLVVGDRVAMGAADLEESRALRSGQCLSDGAGRAGTSTGVSERIQRPSPARPNPNISIPATISAPAGRLARNAKSS
jgi:hypothetical protein